MLPKCWHCFFLKEGNKWRSGPRSFSGLWCWRQWISQLQVNNEILCIFQESIFTQNMWIKCFQRVDVGPLHWQGGHTRRKAWDLLWHVWHWQEWRSGYEGDKENDYSYKVTGSLDPAINQHLFLGALSQIWEERRWKCFEGWVRQGALRGPRHCQIPHKCLVLAKSTKSFFLKLESFCHS